MPSKFFRVAVEGATTDGRKIERTQIEQMAKNYSRDTFGARIWLEHIRGIVPGNVFDALGDVVALKTEEFTVAGEKRLALLAQIEPLPSLVAMNKAKQKLYSSIEIFPKFSDTGEAYLGGLAVTDSPASLGTEMLAFSATAGANSPLAGRKQKPENLFTEALEFSLEMEEQQEPSLLSRVTELLKFKGKTDDKRFADIGAAVEAIAVSQKEAMDKLNAQTASEQTFSELRTELDELKKTDAERSTALTALNQTVEALSAQPNGQGKRPSATGGNGTPSTDC